MRRRLTIIIDPSGETDFPWRYVVTRDDPSTLPDNQANALPSSTAVVASGITSTVAGAYRAVSWILRREGDRS